MDMTKGSIGKSLILFAIPLLLSSIIQQMYNTVDLLFVGNILGKNAAAAVGASSMLITCIIGFFSGIAVGTNVILARIFGTGDKNKFKWNAYSSNYSFDWWSCAHICRYNRFRILLKVNEYTR